MTLPPNLGLPPQFVIPEGEVSKIVMLCNIVSENSLSSESEVRTLLEEVREECFQYGDVSHVLVPRHWMETCSMYIGSCFVKFEDPDGACRAAIMLNNRKYEDRLVKTVFFDADMYEEFVQEEQSGPPAAAAPEMD
jgi:hypothetical protein